MILVASMLAVTSWPYQKVLSNSRNVLTLSIAADCRHSMILCKWIFENKQTNSAPHHMYLLRYVSGIHEMIYYTQLFPAANKILGIYIDYRNDWIQLSYYVFGEPNI